MTIKVRTEKITKITIDSECSCIIVVSKIGDNGLIKIDFDYLENNVVETLLTAEEASALVVALKEMCPKKENESDENNG